MAAEEHLLDGALARAASLLGLALLLAEGASGCARPRLARLGAVLLLGGSASHLLLGAADIADDPSPRALIDVAMRTVFGRSASRTLLVSCALVTVRRITPSLTATIAGALAASFAMSLEGHAASDGAPTMQTVAHALHVACAAGWLGGLAALALSDPSNARSVRRFSAVATTAMVVLLPTGVIRLTAHVSEPLQIASDYGRVLALKLGLVVLALALAWKNRGDRATHSRRLAAELMVGICIFLAAAALCELPPPIAK